MMPAPAADISSLDDAVRRKVLGLVGLGVRARTAIVGAERVREQARKGGIFLAFVAPDASRHSLDKVWPILKARRVHVIEWPSAAELGGAAGRQTTAAIGIVDQALARGIRDAVGGGPAGSPGTDGHRTRRDAQRRQG